MSVVQEIDEILRASGESLAVAESCTGGSIASSIVAIAGSSTYFQGGVVAYSNAAKISILGVDPQNIEQYGAVSEQVAREMAEGVREAFGATYGVATTGIAGPTGGSAEKPVGTVWFGVATPSGTLATMVNCGKYRGDVIATASEQALKLLLCTL
ncbi:MAG: CinA family protein [Rikenellaceae bacterium]